MGTSTRSEAGRPALWILLARLWAGWRDSLIIAQPETVIRRHRDGFRLYWWWKSRPRGPGRPRAAREVREIIALAGARGIAVAQDQLPSTLAAYDGMPPDGTSSMQRDLLAVRPSELDPWTGAVVRLAGASGVNVPTHTFLFAALLPLHRRSHQFALRSR